jgi:serine/threonine protein kinase
LAADERRFGELCVLKEFVPSTETDPVVAQKLRELFHREATILHQLDHPQIPKFFAVFEEDDRLFIAQEYIDGKTYWRLLQERQPHGRAFSQREIVPWLRDLLQVLAYLHGKNIVHRDISPDNIMLPQGQQTPVLIDFGVVKQLIPHLHVAQSGDPADLVQASVSVGKFGYAPYEQIRMGQCSPRSDLYALAVTAVVLLTGRPPNLLMDERSLEWRWQEWVRIDRRLRRILENMMAEKPQDRYASAKVVLEELEAIEVAYLSVDLTPLGHSQEKSQEKSRGSEQPKMISGSSRPSGVPVSALKPSGDDPSLPAIPHPSHASTIATTAEISSGHMTAFEGLAGSDEVTMPGESPDSMGIPPNPIHPTSIESVIMPVASHRWDAAAVTPTAVTPTAVTPTAVTIDPADPLPTLWKKAKAVLHRSPLHRSPVYRSPVYRSPQDRQGATQSLPLNLPLNLPLRWILSLGLLMLLPVGGAVVGIRSPHMASVCWIVNNCANEQETERRYQQAIELADSASVLSGQARSLQDLQQARKRLADSIAQLNAFSGKIKTMAIGNLPKYQTLLQKLDQTLEKETRATQLLSRAEAEAQKATEQAKTAKTPQQYREAQLQWQRVISTLAAIPKQTLVDNQVQARTQEYKARLDAISVKVAATTPSPSPERSPSPTAIELPARSEPHGQQHSITVVPKATVPSPTVVQPRQRSTTNPSTANATRATPARPTRPAQTRSQTAQRSSPRATTAPTARPQPAQPMPSSSPLEVDRRWVAGSMITSATQTLNHVSVWIEGSRTEADGQLTATLMIQNRSGRGFGFVPLYAESKDGNGNPVRSRVLFTGTSATTLEPNTMLTGQISLLEPTSTRQLTLVIEESTSGGRTFRVPF